jgi:hypothetical protein
MGIPFASVATQSPERREKDLHNALNWIRHKMDSMYDPTGEFKRLDSLLPRKRDQSLEDRARELEGTLDWMRQKGLPPFDESDSSNFVNAAFVLLAELQNREPKILPMP